MSRAAASTIGPRQEDVRRLNRAISWSIVVHMAIAGTIFLVPRDWIARRTQPNVMTISLGGTPGVRSTGTTSIGGRTVEREAPPPPRPEPVRPTPKQDVSPVPTRGPARPEPTEAARVRQMPTARAPVTGPQVSAGSTVVDTGARGQGVGLTFGGGGTSGETDLSGFCCPEYLRHLLSTIDSHWQKNQPERGTTVLRFVIRRDGSINDVSVFQSSGSGPLDRIARAALQQSKLLPLPREYQKDTLAIRLTFPYGAQ